MVKSKSIKSIRARAGNKGLILAISTIIIMVALTITGVIAAIMPFLISKRHYVETVTFEYRYNNALRALQTIAYLTKIADGVYDQAENKQGSKMVGEYLAIGPGASDIGFLKTELDRMADKGAFSCYRLTDETGNVLAEKKCGWPSTYDASKYKATMSIVTPDGLAKLTLAVE